ncbi:hypothetical protein ACWOKL_004244 [Vibrio vulnificus]
MKTVIITLLSILLFQGILVVFSGASVVFNDLNGGFTLFVDVASKGATIGVFIWAVFLFQEQRKEKKADTSLQRSKDLSFRLIDFVGSSNYSLNKNSANVLIAYLSSLKAEVGNKNSTETHLKEYKLALDIVNESLKVVTLRDIIGVESENDYDGVIETLTAQYKVQDSLKAIDPDLCRRIESGEISNTNFSINPPDSALRLWQIEEIMKYVFEATEEQVVESLEREPNCFTDKHHHIPVLFAYYYFYTEGILHVSKDKTWSFSTNGILMACEREFCL